MRLLDRLAAHWLRARHWLLFGPDDPGPFAPAPAAAMLTGLGWQVYAPDVPLPLAPPTLEEALAIVHAAGRRVVPLLQPPPLDSVWAPNPKPGKRAPPLHATLFREVVAADGEHVTYRRGGELHTVTLGGWHQWRREMHAVRQEIGA